MAINPPKVDRDGSQTAVLRGGGMAARAMLTLSARRLELHHGRFDFGAQHSPLGRQRFEAAVSRLLPSRMPNVDHASVSSGR
jgi:predicted NAD/FAD-dependent oxidoreductase